MSLITKQNGRLWQPSYGFIYILQIEDSYEEDNIQNAADYKDQSTDEVYLRALFLDIALCRSVARFSDRFADASQRHFCSPLT